MWVCFYVYVAGMLLCESGVGSASMLGAETWCVYVFDSGCRGWVLGFSVYKGLVKMLLGVL